MPAAGTGPGPSQDLETPSRSSMGAVSSRGESGSLSLAVIHSLVHSVGLYFLSTHSRARHVLHFAGVEVGHTCEQQPRLFLPSMVVTIVVLVRRKLCVRALARRSRGKSEQSAGSSASWWQLSEARK